MDFRHLRGFLMIAEEMHLTRAAQRLSMAQPQLTRILHQLEEELGTPLFDRSNKRQMMLTPAGHTFLKGIAPILEQYEEVVQATRRVAQGEGEQAVVGYVPAAMLSDILPQAIRAFEGTRKGELVLRDLSTQSYKGQIKALKEHHLDALFTISPFDEAGIAHECMSKAPMVVALPLTHRLTPLESVPLAALAGEKLIQSPRQVYPRFIDDLTHLCQQAGFDPKIVRRVPHIQAVLSLVASGMGVALLSVWTQLAIQQQNVIYRPLLDMSYQAELHMLWRKDERSLLVQTFLQVVREGIDSGAHDPLIESEHLSRE